MEGATTENARSRCLHGELRVGHEKRNEVPDEQPGLKPEDKIPESKLEQCQGDSYSVFYQTIKRNFIEKRTIRLTQTQTRFTMTVGYSKQMSKRINKRGLSVNKIFLQPGI